MMGQGELMLAWWSGRDSNWNVLPNGTYDVNVTVDEDSDMSFDLTTEANKTLTITIETASITGTVTESDGTTPIVGAEVEAGSYMAWGQARTAANGTFTVAGLEAGATYHLRVQADGKVTAELDVDLPAGETTASAGTITLSDAISITGTIQLPAAFTPFENQWGWMQNELWAWIDAWNMQGPGWGNTDIQFADGESSKPFTINIPPPAGDTTYQVNFHVEGYAASPVEVTVTATGGDTPLSDKALLIPLVTSSLSSLIAIFPLIFGFIFSESRDIS